MQTVEWKPELSFLAQHGGLYKGVQFLFNQAETTKVFYAESHVQPPALDHVKPDLLDRACIRSSTFHVSGFGAEDHMSALIRLTRPGIGVKIHCRLPTPFSCRPSSSVNIPPFTIASHQIGEHESGAFWRKPTRYLVPTTRYRPS